MIGCCCTLSLADLAAWMSLKGLGCDMHLIKRLCCFGTHIHAFQHIDIPWTHTWQAMMQVVMINAVSGVFFTKS